MTLTARFPHNVRVTSPLQIALVGCGSIAPTHAQALAELGPDTVQLTACADAIPARAAAFADRFSLRPLDFPAILADPSIDAVSICTPSGLHAELGVAALTAGKHVIVEKPMDVTLEACDALLAAQKKTKKTLAVISQHRFDAASQTVKKALDAGELGKIILTDARIPWFRTQEYYDSGDWRGTWKWDGGGALMNQGVHTVDLLRWLCGPVKTVYAQTTTAAHARIEVEDTACATLTFENGAIGTLMATTAAYPGFAARLAVHGTRGTAIIEGDTLHTLAVQGRETIAGEVANAHAVQVATGGTRAATERRDETASSVWGDAHRAQLADFLHCCRTGETPLVDGNEGRRAVELVLAVYESARTGNVVQL